MTSNEKSVLNAAVEWTKARYNNVNSLTVQRAEYSVQCAVESYLAEKSNDVCATCEGREKIWLADTGNTVPCPTCQKNAEKDNYIFLNGDGAIFKRNGEKMDILHSPKAATSEIEPIELSGSRQGIILDNGNFYGTTSGETLLVFKLNEVIRKVNKMEVGK